MNNDAEERGLTILVPEAEDFVRAFRAQYDSLAANKIPAHISINHPFCPATIHPGLNEPHDVQSRPTRSDDQQRS